MTLDVAINWVIAISSLCGAISPIILYRIEKRAKEVDKLHKENQERFQHLDDCIDNVKDRVQAVEALLKLRRSRAASR